VLHELLHGLLAVHHRINKHYGFPPPRVLVGELLGLFSMDTSMIEISKGKERKTRQTYSVARSSALSIPNAISSPPRIRATSAVFSWRWG
jgi:hypothetical protein